MYIDDYGYGYGGFRPYMSVAQRLARGRREVARLAKKRGRAADPVTIEGRQIARTFWGQAWCDNLERYSDFANRLPRGRTYVRNGSVLDLQLAPGRVEALVAGHEIYRIEIDLTRLPAARWKRIIAGCAGKIGSLIGLLRGELSPEVLGVLTRKDSGLFPTPRELTMRCSCPDWAGLCKHLAAVLYGIGARLDQRPELFFTLRRVDQAELIAAAGRGVDALAGAGVSRRVSSTRTLLAADRVADVFGIELDEPPAVTSKPRAAPRIEAPIRRRTSRAGPAPGRRKRR
jgi:uncharacterized Zn finger protein